MAQRGRLVVCGDAGEALGDSIYETHVYVRGARREPRRRLRREGAARRAPSPSCASCSSGPASTTSTRREFRRYGSARQLYNFKIDNAGRTDVRDSDAADGTRGLRESHLFDRNVIAEIQRAAREGIYDIRGFGAKRRLPHFDDLLLLGASISRYPLEGYRERCDTDVVLGTRFAKKPLELKIPITIAGMSFGALSAPAKEALGRGATRGRHLDDDRRRRHDARGARALEDARLPAAPVALRHEPRRPAPRRRDRGRRRPGREAGRRRDAARPQDLRPRRGDARPAEGHRPAQRVAATPTGPGPTTSRSRSSSCARSPTGRSRSSSRSARRARTTTSQLAVKAGADVIVVDGMQGGTAATQDVFIEHVGIPTLPAVRLAVEALQELGMHRKVQLIVSGGIRTRRRRREGARARRRRGLDRHRRADRDGRQQPRVRRGVPRARQRGGLLRRLAGGPRPGRASRPRTTSSPARFDPVVGGRRVANYLRVLTLEAQTLARACGKSHVHNLEPEDLVALTVEAAAMARVPLAGTSWIPGVSGSY